MWVTCGGASLLFPKGASPLTPSSRHFPFQCLYQGAKREDEFCWPVALQADGYEGASSGLCAVSLAAVQDRNVYSPWDSHHHNQSSTHLSENTWELLRDFIFYFYGSVEKQMFSNGYFTMDLVLFPPSLKAAARGWICCSVSQFPCFKVTHSKNFARALRWRYVPQI